VSPILANNDIFFQEILTEGEDSVQLTSSNQPG
jgi:hypothetical protein